jgi:hypothetical protein
MKTAVMVVACDRPDYFGQVMASLERNPEAGELPFWFFLDQGREEESRQVEAIAGASKIREKHLVTRPENLGTGRNIISGLRRLFDVEEYERLIVFEDDLVVNPQYIGLTLRLSDEYHQYANVGTIQAHVKNRKPLDEQRPNLHKLHMTSQHFWGYCMTRGVWEAIKPHIYEYENKFLRNIETYWHRDHCAIHRWMALKFRAVRKQPAGEKLLKVPEAHKKPAFTRTELARWWCSPFMMFDGVAWVRRLEKKCRGIFFVSSGQDGVVNLALQIEGFHRIATLVPRTRYVGEIGVHSDSSVFKQQGWVDVNTVEWPEDEHPHAFSFRWKD